MARDGAVETAPALTFDRVTKRYRGVVALEGVSFEVRAGEFLSLLGPSGSGKTTIQRLTGGFETLDSGEIRIAGANVKHLPAHLRSTTTVFQSGALFPHLTVFENVAFGLRVRGVGESDLSRRTRRALEIVRLAGFDERLPSELSGGQKQRVALARALVVEPSIVLFDEPLSALDLNLRLELRSEIKALHDELGFTAVYVTHDQSEALAMSDRIAILNAGRIEQIDRPEIIFNEPRSPFAFQFLGETSSLRVYIESGCARLEDTKLDLPASFVAKSGDAELCFRPGWLRLGDEAESDNRITGRLKSREFQGDVYRYHVSVGKGDVLKIDRKKPLDIEIGESIAVRWNRSDAVVFQ